MISIVCPDVSYAYTGNESIIVLTHSTGRNLYNEGGVADWFTQYNQEHDTNYSITRIDYPTNGYPWKNYPYDWWKLWVNGSCVEGNPNMECLDNLADEYDVIIWKQCFPGASVLADTGSPDISSERKSLENYKLQYRALRDLMAEYQNNTFIVWTLVPLVEGATNPDDAARAKEFVDWVKDEWLFEDGFENTNIFVFDFWGLVAGPDNYLRDEYERSSTDSHPNTYSNTINGPIFAQFIVDTIENRSDLNDSGNSSGNGTEEYVSECYDWKTRHPEWLLCDDFEDFSEYDNIRDWHADSQWITESHFLDDGRIEMSRDAFQGNYSVFMPALASAGYQGSELEWHDCVGEKHLGCTQNGHEKLYFRTYVKFHKDHNYVHHFLNIGGTKPDGYWEGMGNAGCRPNGFRSAGTTVDFNAGNTTKNGILPREAFFYTYSVDMHCDPGYVCDRYSDATRICNGCAAKDMPCNTNGEECCWGNHYNGNTKGFLPREEWICLEMMMQLNTPNVKDGVMAFWINDELIHEQDDMFWRTIPELQLNTASLQHYITTGDANGKSNKVWFDNTVISTERIGCIDYVPPERCTSADTNRDNRVQNNEFHDFMLRWMRSGSGFDELISIILVWKNGC